jgi:hypothetical protein
MATPGQPTSYKPEYCELAHNYCLLGATSDTQPAAPLLAAALDAAGESMRHAGD